MRKSPVVFGMVGALLLALTLAITGTGPAHAATAISGCPDGGYTSIADQGQRIKAPDSAAIYLIDTYGYRRWIPNAETYNSLFRDWNGIVTRSDTRCILQAGDMTDGYGGPAFLMKSDNASYVYLVLEGQKRWIISAASFDKYYFSWSKIHVYSAGYVDSWPSGSMWI
jgi:hypothetical protein